MKYIDADKLTAEIKRRKYEWQAILDKNNAVNSEAIKNAIYEDENILDFITSLQQEQTEILSTPEVENCVWSILKGKERYERGCKFCTAICKMRVEQEQMEVELERKVEDFCLEYDARKEIWYGLTPQDQGLLTKPTWVNFAMNIARHFYELGKARKEE